MTARRQRCTDIAVNSFVAYTDIVRICVVDAGRTFLACLERIDIRFERFVLDHDQFGSVIRLSATLRYHGRDWLTDVPNFGASQRLDRWDQNLAGFSRTAFGRWTTTGMYGNYAAQPLIGFLNRREGILGTARLKVNPNWVLLGGAGYDLHANQVTQTQVGVGYIDDCLILALNYITSYAYSGSVSVNHTYMMQISLRTLGGTTSTGAQGVSPINSGAFGSAQ